MLFMLIGSIGCSSLKAEKIHGCIQDSLMYSIVYFFLLLIKLIIFKMNTAHVSILLVFSLFLAQIFSVHAFSLSSLFCYAELANDAITCYTKCLLWLPSKYCDFLHLMVMNGSKHFVQMI